jgi:hypothetical protein
MMVTENGRKVHNDGQPAREDCQLRACTPLIPLVCHASHSASNSHPQLMRDRLHLSREVGLGTCKGGQIWPPRRFSMQSPSWHIMTLLPTWAAKGCYHLPSDEGRGCEVSAVKPFLVPLKEFRTEGHRVKPTGALRRLKTDSSFLFIENLVSNEC